MVKVKVMLQVSDSWVDHYHGERKKSVMLLHDTLEKLPSSEFSLPTFRSLLAQVPANEYTKKDAEKLARVLSNKLSVPLYKQKKRTLVMEQEKKRLKPLHMTVKQ